jgi:cell division protein FtsB
MLLQQGSQAIRIRNLEEDNEQLNGLVNDHSVQINVLVEEKQVLQATIQELEARVEELEARVDYVEAITRKDGKHFGLLK